MSEQGPYELLGVTEGASFDEIQAARDRLMDASGQVAGAEVEQIEAAYDAVLMHRLRLRQEGKIKVPERIRFPERTTPPPKAKEPEISQKLPAWMKEMADQPSGTDILLPALVTLTLMGIAVFGVSPTSDGGLELILALGAAASIYFLNRKEGRFGRAFLITMASMFAGLVVGTLLTLPLEGLLNPQNLGNAAQTAIALSPKQFIVVVSLATMGTTSSFLR